MRRGCLYQIWFYMTTAIALSAVGCATTPSVSTDIVQVATFYNQEPWLNFDPIPTDVPGGLRFTLYLAPTGSPKGVFGDGTIHVEMYRVERAADGKVETALVRRWSFTTDEARVYRARDKRRLGWGYGIRLDWGDVDVLGREIMVIVSFERKDGRTVRGRPKNFQVPHRV